MFQHQNIHKSTWNTHNHNDHILRDGRWHSSILDLRSFRGADCETYHYLVVAKVRERLAVNKQAAQTFDVERFNLRERSELEFRKEYQIKISNKFSTLENFNDSEGINRAWKNIKRTSNP